jgi:hypothetical protein
MNRIICFSMQGLLAALLLFNGATSTAELAAFLAVTGILSLGTLGTHRRVALPAWFLAWGLGACVYCLLRWRASAAFAAAGADVTLILAYALLAFLGMVVFQEREARQKILLTLLAIAALNALAGVAQAVTHAAVVPSVFRHLHLAVNARASGMLPNPNYLGELSAIGLPLVIIYAFWPGREGASRARVIKCVLTGFLLVGALSVSGSRGGLVSCWIATAIACFWLLRKGVSIKPLVPVILSILVLQAATLVLHGDALSRTANIGKTTLQNNVPAAGEGLRMSCWKASLELWKKEPLLGVGPRMYDLRWHEVQPERVQDLPVRVHDLWLQVLCEYGAVGLIIFVIPLIAIGRRLVPRGDTEDWTRAAAACGLIASLIHETFDYSYYCPLIGFGVICLFTVIAARPPAKAQVPPIVIQVGLAALAGVILLFGVRTLGMDRYERRARACKDMGQMEANIEVAARWMPQSDAVFLELGKARLARETTMPPSNRNWSEDARIFQRALDLNPYSMESRYFLALILAPNSLRAALKQAEELESMAPNSAKMAALSFEFYSAIGQTNTAAKWNRRMTELLKYKFESFAISTEIAR